MTPLDRLDALEREARYPGGVARAIAYQDFLHTHGRALIDVARAARVALNAPNAVKVPHAGAVGRTESAIATDALEAALAPLLEEEE